MRDDHRTKHELVHEITGLRKQVADLKEAMAARRRVEDALREREGVLRDLADCAPVGLALFRGDGSLIVANRPLASMLGYDSPADLIAMAPVLGLFASAEERTSALSGFQLPGSRLHRVSLRTKNGCRQLHAVLAGRSAGLQKDLIGLAVFDAVNDSANPVFLASSA